MKIPKFEAQTEWVKPTEFPDLRQVDEIAIDLETRDPDLTKTGSGAIIGNGEVIGIAVATKHYKGYFPIAHEGGGNMDKVKVLEWLKDILESTSTKIFHNAMYDVCWLKQMGFKINGDIVCTMIAAAVTDENRFRYDLNSLSWHYLGFGKFNIVFFFIDCPTSNNNTNKAELSTTCSEECAKAHSRIVPLNNHVYEMFGFQ